MTKKLIIGLTIAAVIGVGAYAFAHRGEGYGYHGWMHGGSGMHHRDYDRSGYGYPDNMKNEDIKALEEERTAFFKDTETIRRDLYSKELELKSELLKNNPDVSKAVTIQKDISELQSNLDQQRIEHMIKIRKLNPNAGRGGMMGGYHMGYGNSSDDPCVR